MKPSHDRPFTAFITQHALSKGIRERLVFKAKSRDGYTVGSHANLRHVSAAHVHKTREEAVAKAKQMRAAKIAALRKEIARLKSLTF